MREVVDGVSNAVLWVSVTVVGWGTFITRKVWKHDEALARLCTKQDTMYDLLKEVREDQKKRNGT